MTDQKIIEVIQSGNRANVNKALRDLYKYNFESVKALVLKTRGNAEDASDVFQNAMLVVYQHVKSKKFLGNSSLKTYIYAVSRNMWFKTLKDRSMELSSESFIDELSTVSYQEIEDFVITYEKKLTFSHLLEQLGESCKAVLSDFYYKGLTLQEIASKHELANDATAKNKKYRCMIKLMALIKNQGIKMQDIDVDTN